MLYSDKAITPLKLTFNDINLPVYTFNTLIVGSGAAGLNAADSLFNMGQKDIAILTDGMKRGVSKNSGDNGQVYYRAASVSLSDSQSSVYDMAEELSRYGSMDGDIALAEAALSSRCFHKLADLGMDFPQNIYGEFLDYAEESSMSPPEHGVNIRRSIDAGRFTARKITECLEEKILDRNIPIFNRFRVISIIKDEDEDGNQAVVGLLAIDRDMQQDYKVKIDEYMRNSRRATANKDIFSKIQKKLSGREIISSAAENENFYTDDCIEEPLGNKYGYTLFRAVNIIYAAGAPGGIYSEKNSLYPSDTLSSFSPAFAIGVTGKNLTETKFGIGAVVPGKYDDALFKWKMSGVFQKAIPRYFSTDNKGNDERDFLDDYFESKIAMLDAIADKACNWHFDVRKLHTGGSSIIDLAVYIEKQKGRKVYLDYFYNPSCLKPDENGEFDDAVLRKMEADRVNIEYRPYERLIMLDFDSYKLFYDNGMDLKRNILEIEICAEHLNGGLSRDIYSESNIKHFFPVGEAAATFGVYAPRGSSLNSTQVTSLRAAQKIVRDYNSEAVSLSDFWAIASDEVYKYVVTARQLLKNAVTNVASTNILDMREKYRNQFSECTMIVRPLNDVLAAISDCVMDMVNFIHDNAIDDAAYLPDAFINHDILVTQYTFLYAIKNYILSGGRSRGSYIIVENDSDITENKERFIDEKGFASLLEQKIKHKQRKSVARGILSREVEEYIEETDFDRLISCIRIKSFLTYEIEFSTEEIRAIPYKVNTLAEKEGVRQPHVSSGKSV